MALSFCLRLGGDTLDIPSKRGYQHSRTTMAERVVGCIPMVDVHRKLPLLVLAETWPQSKIAAKDCKTQERPTYLGSYENRRN